MARKLFPVFALLVIVSLLASCSGSAPAVVEKEKIVQQTVVVEKAVEKTVVVEKQVQVTQQVVKEVVVTPTPGPRGVAKPANLPLDKAKISVSSKLANLDPAGQSFFQPDIISQYLASGRLFRLNNDFSVVPELAESMATSDDGLTMTVTLKSGLKYSDGTPIKAEDAAYAYTRHRDLKGPYLNALGPVDSVTAPDDLHVVYKLKSPYPAMGISLSHMALSLHPKSKIEADKDYFKHPVSSGQYVVKQWVPGTLQWSLAENPNNVDGPLAIKNLDIIAIPDTTSRLLQLSTGAIDYVYDLPFAVRSSLPPEVETHSILVNGIYYLPVNLSLPENSPLRNKDVRHAISMAIDREEVNQKAFGGLSKPVDSFLYSNVPEHIATLENGGKRDLEGAKKLLATTPFAKGFKMTMQPWGQRPGWTDAALVIKQNLADLGIEVDVQPVDDATAGQNMKSGAFETQFAAGSLDPLTLLRYCFVPGNGWSDATRYNNPETKALLDKAQSARSQDEYLTYMHDALKLIQEDMAYIPIDERITLVGTRLPGLIFEANRQPGFNPRVQTLAEANK
jgi:peptide/nickel transport system substrate-binding protein